MLSIALLTAASLNDYSYNFNANSTALRASLLASYDPHVPPSSQRATGHPVSSDAGTDVSLGIRFFQVAEVRAIDGSLELTIWFRLSWWDDRLAWDPTASGITQSYFMASEIWTPELDLYHARTSLSKSLNEQYALVRSDGSVLLSRPGSLDVFCSDGFPTSNLTCTLEFGGWILSDAYQGVELMQMGNAGYDLTPINGRAYTIDAVTASKTRYEYACCPYEPFEVLTYVVTISGPPICAAQTCSANGDPGSRRAVVTPDDQSGLALALGLGLGLSGLGTLALAILIYIKSHTRATGGKTLAVTSTSVTTAAPGPSMEMEDSKL